MKTLIKGIATALLLTAATTVAQAQLVERKALSMKAPKK
jgi:hypothetical protein